MGCVDAGTGVCQGGRVSPLAHWSRVRNYIYPGPRVIKIAVAPCTRSRPYRAWSCSVCPPISVFPAVGRAGFPGRCQSGGWLIFWFVLPSFFISWRLGNHTAHPHSDCLYTCYVPIIDNAVGYTMIPYRASSMEVFVLFVRHRPHTRNLFSESYSENSANMCCRSRSHKSYVHLDCPCPIDYRPMIAKTQPYSLPSVSFLLFLVVVVIVLPLSLVLGHLQPSLPHPHLVPPSLRTHLVEQHEQILLLLFHIAFLPLGVFQSNLEMGDACVEIFELWDGGCVSIAVKAQDETGRTCVEELVLRSFICVWSVSISFAWVRITSRSELINMADSALGPRKRDRQKDDVQRKQHIPEDEDVEDNTFGSALSPRCTVSSSPAQRTQPVGQS